MGHRRLTTTCLTGSDRIVFGPNGNLDLVQSGDSTYGGTVAEAGRPRKSGAGTLTLTGANRHGDTRVDAGTLADAGRLTIGRSGTFVAGTTDTVGAIRNEGRVDIATDLVATGIANAGRMDVDGKLVTFGDVWNGGEMTLREDIAVAGALTNVGRLDVTGPHEIATRSGFRGNGRVDLADDATLGLRQAGDGVYRGVFAGDGGLTKTGGGRLTLMRDRTSAAAWSSTGASSS